MDGPHLPQSSAETTTESRPVRFDDICRHNLGFVRNIVRRHGIPEHSVEDLAQDVLVTAWLIRHRLHTPGGARAWLRRIALYCTSNWKRSRSRSIAKHQAYAMLPQCSRAVQDSDRLTTRRELEFFLSLLDEPKRQAFVLTEAYGMTATEIADELGLNDNTIRSRLHKARQLLRNVTLTMDASTSVAIETRMLDMLREKVRTAKRRSDDELLAILPAPLLFAAGEPIATGSVASPFGSSVIAEASADLSSHSVTEASTAMGQAALESTTGLGGVGLGSSAVIVKWVAAAAVVITGAVFGMAPDDAPHPAVVASIDVEPPPVVASKLPDAPVPLLAPSPGDTEPTPVAPVSTATDDVPAKPRRLDRAASLAAETKLLDAALIAQRRGDDQAALAPLRRHARRFPHGQLAPSRVGSMVRVLCRLGRYDDATDVAARSADSPQARTAAQTALEGRDCRRR